MLDTKNIQVCVVCPSPAGIKFNPTYKYKLKNYLKTEPVFVFLTQIIQFENQLIKCLT